MNYIKNKYKTNGIYFYKNAPKSSEIPASKKAQGYCISICKEDEQVIKKSDNSVIHLWGIVKENEMEKFIEKDNNIYEILQENKKMKVYFDIDINPEKAKNKDFEKHLELCKNVISSQFPNCNFQISGNKSDNKFSYHIILSNYYVKDLNSLKFNVQPFCECYTDYGFDKSVYKSNQAMKCINQSKGYKREAKKLVKDNRIQSYIEGSKKPSKHLILFNFDEDCKDICELDFSDYQIVIKEDSTPLNKRIRVENRKRGVDITQIKPEIEKELPWEFDYSNSTPIQKLRVLPNYSRDSLNKLSHDICWKVMIYCNQFNLSFENFWEWYKIKDSSISAKQRYLEYWGYSDNYTTNPKFLDNLLEMFYPKLKKDYNYHRFEKLHDISSLTTRILEENEYLNEKMINNEIKTTICAVGCGKNKTGSFINFTLDKYSDKKILVLVPRITLAYDISKRAKELCLENYKEISNGERYLDIDKLILSTSSLYKLKQFNEIKKYDIIIADEFETLLNTFTTDKIHGNGNYLKDNWDVFKTIMIEAKKVILMDAITTRKTIEFVNNLEIGPFELINNKRKITRNLSSIVDFDFNDWIKMILKDLKEGKKLFIFMPYKESKEAQSLKGILPLTEWLCNKMGWTRGVEIKEYYAEAYENKKQLKNVNEVWKNVKCVITNTCNSVGVNYEGTDFDKIYSLYADWINPRDFIQVLYRLRNLIDNNMIVYFEKSQNSLLKRDNNPVVKLLANYCKVYDNLLRLNNIEEQNFSKNALYNLCENNGIKIVVNELEIPENLPSLDIKEDDDFRITWNKIKDIDKEEYNKLNKKLEIAEITLYEKYQIEKYRFRIKNKSEATERELSLMFMNREYIEKLSELNKNENHPINRLLKMNNINIFNNDEIKAWSNIPKNFKLKDQKEEFLDYFKFLRIEKNWGPITFMKVINAYFGFILTNGLEYKIEPITNKRYKSIELSDEFKQTIKLYKKYNRIYDKNMRIYKEYSLGGDFIR